MLFLSFIFKLQMQINLIKITLKTDAAFFVDFDFFFDLSLYFCFYLHNKITAQINFIGFNILSMCRERGCWKYVVIKKILNLTDFSVLFCFKFFSLIFFLPLRLNKAKIWSFFLSALRWTNDDWWWFFLQSFFQILVCLHAWSMCYLFIMFVC